MSNGNSSFLPISDTKVKCCSQKPPLLYNNFLNLPSSGSMPDLTDQNSGIIQVNKLTGGNQTISLPLCSPGIHFKFIVAPLTFNLSKNLTINSYNNNIMFGQLNMNGTVQTISQASPNSLTLNNNCTRGDTVEITGIGDDSVSYWLVYATGANDSCFS
jgi:hypothetical protein